MKKMLLMMLLAICTLSISAQSASNKDATIVSDIQYKSNQDAYVNERCKLDIYYSKGQKDCPVVVYGVDANQIAGLIPFSGQMISHFAYRKMNGIDNLQPTIDKYAPLFHVRKDAAPLILITGDRNIELFGRYEENAYMWRMMNLVGRPDTQLYEIAGHGHGAMGNPAYHILIQSINKILGKKYEF